MRYFETPWKIHNHVGGTCDHCGRRAGFMAMRYEAHSMAPVQRLLCMKHARAFSAEHDVALPGA